MNEFQISCELDLENIKEKGKGKNESTEYQIMWTVATKNNMCGKEGVIKGFWWWSLLSSQFYSRSCRKYLLIEFPDPIFEHA